MIVEFEQNCSFDINFIEENDYSFANDELPEIEVVFEEYNFICAFADEEIFACSFGGSGEEYFGPYEITPGERMQTLDTASKALTENIVIKPIPSNYGKLIWDGHILRLE